jgi:pSer/pThr/pTyr-binding forkhead associated (FHA) protein
MARLILESAPGGAAPGQTFDLDSASVSIGREPGNTIVLSGEAKASRQHCRVAKEPKGWEVADLGSTNGTRVNGDPVKRRTLRNGDVIEVGLTRIRFEDEASAARDAATAGACFLEYTYGDRKGERIPLTGSRVSLGRRESNTIVLEDKMASGHHAEITKDVNGWTLRDLGSTNGTLVNGEPTTEALLTHGTRVRVGNARFVFKDPSMADVDVELAGLEEDDAGWGMMAEIDLSKGRGGAGGVIAAVLLLLALVGASWWVVNRPASDSARAAADTSNLVVDGGFDSGETPGWVSDEDPPVASVALTQKGHKGAALEVRHRGEAAGDGLVRYGEELAVSPGSAYEASAWMSKSGDAAFVVQWVGKARLRSGATAVTQTVPVGSPPDAGSWAKVSRTLTPPKWAQVARLAVRVAKESSAKLDDVRFEPGSGGTSPVSLEGGRDVDAVVASTGALDLTRTATVLVVGASPWATLADGRVVGGPAGFRAKSVSRDDGGVRVDGTLADGKGDVPGSVAWRRSAEGVVGKVTVEGATSVGLSADLPRAHVETEGISALGAFSPARLESKAGQTLDGAKKVLVGDPAPRPLGNPEKPEGTRPQTLLAFVSQGGQPDLRLDVSDADDPGQLRLTLWRKGTSVEVAIVTDFEGERAQAQTDLSAAVALAGKTWGAGIRRLREVAQTYPFEKGVRDTALAEAAKAEDAASKAIRALAAAVTDAEVYGSDDAIAAAEKRVGELSAQFEPTDRGFGAPVAENAQKVRALRLKHDVAKAAPEAKRLVRLAEMLENEKGFQPLAAVYYDDVVTRFGSLEAAGGDLAALVKQARERRDELLKNEEVRKAFPARPGLPPPAPPK